MANLKVLMMGGRRAGKSSVLAGIVDALYNNEIQRYITMFDTGKGVINGASLSDKKNDLMDFIDDHPAGKYYLVDFHADSNFSTYIIGVKLPGRREMMEIEFVDAPGESYASTSAYYDDVKKHVETSDVFIIIIDTPYLMGVQEGNVKRGTSLKYNRITEITTLLNFIKLRENCKYDLKKVLFIPVKCEKWRYSLDEVTEEVKKVYAIAIQNLLAYQQISISIMPIFTANGIEFDHFSDPRVVVNSKKPNNSVSCEVLNESLLRLGNGKSYQLHEGDQIVEDPEAIATGIPFYAWYKSVGDYKPYLCEQPALHIMRFLLYKEEITKNNAFFLWIFISSLFGGISVNDLRTAIQGLLEKGYIKDSGNGLKHIKLIER